MGSLALLVKNLPLILGLLASIQKALDEIETEKRVEDQLVKVKDAFDKKDASALNDLFNS